jgi:DNA-binding XRE family transcriptional regulator
MTELSELKSKWLKDSKVKKAYANESLEFAIAKKLISERLKARLTQEEIAKKMGTTQSAIARIESGAQLPSMKTIESYAHALGKFPEVRFKSHHDY